MAIRMSKNAMRVLGATDETKLIVTPRLNKWLTLHGDDPLTPELAEWVVKQLTTPERVRHHSFSSSSSGFGMRRQILAYMNAEHPVGIDPQLQQIFQNGTWSHLRLQTQLVMAGILRIEDLEFPLPWPAMRSMGTADGRGVVPDDHPNVLWRGLTYGLELKTANMFTAQAMKDPEKYIDQISRYFLSGGFDLFAVVVENKNSQECKEWVVERKDARIKEQQCQLKELNGYVDRKELPPRDAHCLNHKSKEFRDCPFGRNAAGVCAMSETWDDVKLMPMTKAEAEKVRDIKTAPSKRSGGSRRRIIRTASARSQSGKG